jgi:hypothetical protein
MKSVKGWEYQRFYLGVYACYRKGGIVGYVEEIREGDKLMGVRIRIGDCNESLRERA